MKIAVVGVGAIGGSVAAAMADAGHEPLLCVRTPFGQLRRVLDGTTDAYESRILLDASSVEPVSLVVLATKAHQTADALSRWSPLIGPDTAVAVLQNGVDHTARVQPLLPDNEVVPVVVQLPAELEAPGVVRQERTGLLQCPRSPGGALLGEVLPDGGAVVVREVDDFISKAWAKLLANSVTGAVCAMTDRTNEVFRDPGIVALTRALCAETMRVGEAEGASFEPDAVERLLQLLTEVVPNHVTSLLADQRAGRPTEWRVRNEIVCRLGRHHGIPTPVNDLCTALLAARDPLHSGTGVEAGPAR